MTLPQENGAGAAPFSASYTTLISTTRGASTATAPGLPLVLTVRRQEGSPRPTVEARLGGEDVTGWLGVGVDGSDRLILSVMISGEGGFLCEDGNRFYLSCKALLDADALNFTGAVHATCADPGHEGAAPYHWQGTADHTFAALRGTPDDPWPALLAAAREGTPR
ncbi:hypothetical protein ACIQWA_03940 [Kitasatospora sp. NPDC098652]|uniref:hypothetical protein n=1 Tax=Kitasatospora sp. NPDC098652 TaxID=3364095 RepID=UPI003823F76A